MTLTVERLRELLDYDPMTGVFTWKVSMRGNVRAGHVAGTINDSGYRHITISGKIYKAHRLAWLYSYGKWPSKFIDHINMDPDDNCLSNLREASNAENMRNSGKKVSNKSGFKGVSWSNVAGKWMAQIRVNGERKNLGYFSTAQDAHAVYCDAAKQYHGEFARVD